MVRRPLIAAGLVLACVAAVSAVSPAADAAQAPAASPAACNTAQPIQISSLIWQPPAVYPGQSSQAIATVVDCTGVTQSAEAEWLGRFVYPVGPPPGCPVIDPFIRSLTLPPFGSVSQSTGYLVPIGCMATGLIVTVDILQNGAVVATRSAQRAAAHQADRLALARRQVRTTHGDTHGTWSKKPTTRKPERSP